MVWTPDGDETHRFGGRIAADILWPMAGIVLITGPQAAGKTTVSGLLARRFHRGVHLDGDAFRRSIVAGRAEMTPDASDEALGQLRLRYRITASAAQAYVEAGFEVVVDDVVAGPMLAEVVDLLRIGPDRVFVLLPSRSVLADREAQRSQKGYGPWSVDELSELFESGTPRIGTWIDTSSMTAPETADLVFDALRRPSHGPMTGP
jgi:chloramphenicol 3-O-phosphotransferase